MLSQHIVITGSKQVGKSTLVNKYLDALGVPYAGFRTKRIDLTSAGPIYALEEITTGRQGAISKLYDNRIVGIPSTFDNFGTEVVHNAIKEYVPVLLFDEIGRFEHNSVSFLSALDCAFDSGKKVIAVLKKEDIPHIQRIRHRPDICLIDLDEVSMPEAFEQLIEENRLSIKNDRRIL